MIETIMLKIDMIANIPIFLLMISRYRSCLIKLLVTSYTFQQLLQEEKVLLLYILLLIDIVISLRNIFYN